MTYKEYKKSALANNPDLRKEYENLAPQYEIIDAVIAARLEKTNDTDVETLRSRLHEVRGLKYERKGLEKNQKILDHMGSTELAANLFRATQTDEKLRRDKTKGKDEAGATHYKVGRKVRQTIEELGGTMPENLPTPDKSIRQIEKEEQKKIDGG